MIQANVLISGVNGIVCNAFLLISSRRMSTLGPSFSLLSSYQRDMCGVVGRTSNISWMDSLVTYNFLPRSQKFMRSPSTEALAQNSLMILAWIFPIGFNSCLCPFFEHFRNESVFQGLLTPQSMSASSSRNAFEEVRGRLEDFFVADFLRGDICKTIINTKKQGQTQKQGSELNQFQVSP